jgi:hypothetical protein
MEGAADAYPQVVLGARRRHIPGKVLPWVPYTLEILTPSVQYEVPRGLV